MEERRHIHSVRLKTTGAETVCGSEQTVLEAYLRENVWLPHGCSQGTCGSCKVQVIEGEVDHGESPVFTLTEQERSDDLALACQARPRSDLLVEPIADIVDDGAVRHPLRDVLGTVAEITDIARETRRLVIDLDESLPFTAGQYVELTVPGTEVRRQYSMANPPSETSRLELHIRRTAGGIATDGWLFAGAAVGDRVEVRGPLGVFGPGRPQSEPAVLVAGGTGLAPMKSIALAALSEDMFPEIWLFHGGRVEADLYDTDFFRDLEAWYPNFHFRPCLSEQEWDGLTGLVTEVVMSEFSSCKGMTGYLCGPPGMVQAGVRAFRLRRMAPRLIFKEEFAGTSTPVSWNNP